MMGWQEFTLSIVGALAWPVAVFISAVVVARAIRDTHED